MSVERILKHLSFVVVFVCGVTGCSETPVERGPESKAAQESAPEIIVSLNGHTPLIAPILLTADQKDSGVAIKVQPHGTGRDAVASLLAGHSDFAVTSETPLVHAALQGQSFKIIATYVRSQKHLKCIARRDRGIESISDLAGKTLATAKGTNFEYFMHQLLKKNATPFQEDKFQNLNSPDMVAAIVAGQVDAVFVHEPFISRIQDALPRESTIIFQPDDVYDLTYNIVVSTTKAPKTETQVMFLKAIAAAISDMSANSEKAIEVAAKESGIPKDVMRRVWPDYRWKLSVEDSLIDLILQEAQWVNSQSPDHPSDALLPERIRSLIDAEPLRSLDPTAVTLR